HRIGPCLHHPAKPPVPPVNSQCAGRGIREVLGRNRSNRVCCCSTNDHSLRWPHTRHGLLSGCLLPDAMSSFSCFLIPFGLVVSARCVCLNNSFNLTTPPAEDRELFVFRSGGVCGVILPPMVAVRLAWEYGASLVGVTPRRDHR